MLGLCICVISLGDPKGRVIAENSLQLFHDYIKMVIPTYNLHFSETCIIGDWAEKMEAEAYTQGENSVLILENVFFNPEEAGFICDE